MFFGTEIKRVGRFSVFVEYSRQKQVSKHLDTLSCVVILTVLIAKVLLYDEKDGNRKETSKANERRTLFKLRIPFSM